MKLAEFLNQWNNIELTKCFEMPVLNKTTKESDYIIFDISIVGRSFIAQHEPLTKRQIKSKKIACIKQLIDLDFSLDENLNSLYESCYLSIHYSNLFEHLE